MLPPLFFPFRSNHDPAMPLGVRTILQILYPWWFWFYKQQPTFSSKILRSVINFQQINQGQSLFFFFFTLLYPKSYSVDFTKNKIISSSPFWCFICLCLPCAIHSRKVKMWQNILIHNLGCQDVTK